MGSASARHCGRPGPRDSNARVRQCRVDVAVIDNGNRFTTYVIEQPAGSGDIVINGAAAHLCQPGMKVIIMGYAQFDEKEADAHKPKIVKLDGENRIKA